MRNESLSHVLQKCPAGHIRRINRHDCLVKKVVDIATKQGWRVEVEPKIRLRDGQLRIPNLVMSKENVVVCDVEVSSEGNSPLNVAHRNKVAIYSTEPMLQALAALYPGKTITVEACIMGARGIWPECNDRLKSILNLTDYNVRELVCKTLIGSIAIHRAFNTLVHSMG